MPLQPISPHDRHSSAPRWRRWAVVGTLTLLLHLSALDWATHQLGPALHETPAVMQASLQAPPAEPLPPPVKPAPRKPSSQKPKAKPVAPPSPSVNAPPDINETANMVESGEKAESDTADSKDGKQTEAGSTRYKVAPPPSVELNYDVEALLGGQTWNGSGKINWVFNGGAYVINGEASALITVLSFGSTGGIDEYGIAPVRYSEKPFRKSEVATHFTRERSTISFSASTVSYPIKGGEQDRASIIWQLASIGRGEREKFAANVQFPVFVAGVRDGEVWNIQVIGEESIDTGIGKLAVWHLVRTPRPGSYDKKLDIWLAPEREWYPVRLRYTDVNGEYLDMAVSSIAIAPPSR